MKYPIKIKIRSGTITVYSDSPNPHAGKCKGCGKDILWVKTNLGKSMPVSKLDDGTLVSHFVDCPQANRFRKKKTNK